MIKDNYFTHYLENSKLSPFSEVLDDKFLIGFLRGKKYKVDDTIKCVRRHAIFLPFFHEAYLLEFNICVFP